MKQIQLFITFDENDATDLPLPEVIARGGKDWQVFPLQSQDVDGKRYYAVQDWIAGIAQTDKPRMVWADMKRRYDSKNVSGSQRKPRPGQRPITKETAEWFQSQLLVSLRQLKYRAADGKNYTMDFADAETLYKITQRMDANTGIRNRVLDYLAKAGVIVDEQRLDPGKAIDAGIAGYKRKGKSDQWIKTRIDGKIDRKTFVAALSRAITSWQDSLYAAATNVGYESIFGFKAPDLRRMMGIPENANVREHMSRTGLIYVSLLESIVADHLGQQHDLTFDQAKRIIAAVGASLKPAVDAYRNTLGIDPVSGRPILPAPKPTPKKK